MVSAETKMTVARSCVVLSTVAAGLCVASLLRLPIFVLDMDSIKSSITQSLFTTDIYTPAGEKHIPVHSFTEKCEALQNAFRIAQASTIAAVVLLSLTFVCGVFHLAPSFSNTNTRVRKVCGAPICILLLLSVIALGVNGYVVKAMYEKDTWCSNGNDTVAISAILRENTRRATGYAVRVVDGPVAASHTAAFAATLQEPVLPSMTSPFGDKKKCNPFEDCIASYRDMGFETAVGYRVLWAALGVVIFSMVVEMMVMAVGASVVPQAGVAAETAALLHQQDDDRVI